MCRGHKLHTPSSIAFNIDQARMFLDLCCLIAPTLLTWTALKTAHECITLFELVNEKRQYEALLKEYEAELKLQKTDERYWKAAC